MHRANRGLVRRACGRIHARAARDLAGIQAVSEGANELREPVAHAVHVLADVDAPWPKVGEHFFQGGRLLLLRVTAVVDQDVHLRNSLAKALPHRAVRLISDVDRDLRRLMRHALRIDVYPVPPAAWPEVMPPHRQAAAAEDSDLDDDGIASDESPPGAGVGVRGRAA